MFNAASVVSAGARLYQPAPAAHASPAAASGLNAQLLAALPASRFDAVLLNPQPLPPKDSGLLARQPASPSQSRFGAIALNPQPLPPRDLVSAITGGKSLEDWCGTVPRRVPVPPPPLPGPWAELAGRALARG